LLWRGDRVQVHAQAQPGLVGQYPAHEAHGRAFGFERAVLGPGGGDQLCLERAAGQLPHELARRHVAGGELPGGGDPLGHPGVQLGAGQHGEDHVGGDAGDQQHRDQHPGAEEDHPAPQGHRAQRRGHTN